MLFLVSLVFLIIAGIIFLRRTSSITRFELLFPVGSVLGLLLFTFFINIVSFLVKGSGAAVLSYLIIIFLAVILFKKDLLKIDFPKGNSFLLWFLSIFGWGGFIYWKTANALIGSDTNLYYAIAHSFIKGNFPFFTPWQPDIPLSYHVGASELLGVFYYLSGFDFQFLHLFFSALFIFFAIQIVVWMLKRHDSLISFLLSNLVVAVAFISFGFIYIVWPLFPLKLPAISNINQLVIWLRGLPTVNQAIEVYGAPINLDALIYFIFHAFGLAIFFSLLALILYYKKERPLVSWLVVCIGLAGLALVNESLFIAAFPALLLGVFLVEWKNKTLFKNIKVLFLLIAITVVTVFLEGGIISASINRNSNIENSVAILPQKNDVKDDFIGYHLGQEKSDLLPLQSAWLPFRWFHVGIDLLLLLSLVAILVVKDNKNALLIRVLLMAGFSSLVGYNVIVPKFLVANGNRFLSASFLFFSMLLFLSLIHFFEISRKKVIRILLFICLGWIFVFTILPPLALLSKVRFGENKLIPKLLQGSSGILWLKKNAGPKESVIVLDKNAPHPSGQARALVEAGVSAPLFYGNFRVFTIEASPEYIDIAYYLSPKAFKKLKIGTLLIDNVFFETLPEERKQQLDDANYFTKIFEHYDESGWERVYKIKNEYLEKGKELDGTFAQLESVIPLQGEVYIGNEENFSPSFLRRPLIFSLRDRNLYYLPQSGVYLNVETNINFHPPKTENDYEFLILGKNALPAAVCKCQTDLIWKGINGEIYVWKRND